MNKAIITSSWDDGHPLDFKLGKILSKNNIPGTFYIPITNSENKIISENEIKSLAKNFEIGGHTLNHTILTNLSKEEMTREITLGKEKMETICDQISSFAYPGGQYNDEVIDTVKDANFFGARTAELFHIDMKNRFEYHPTVQAVDRIFASRVKQSLMSNNKKLSLFLLTSRNIFKGWDFIAKKTLDYVLEHGGIWHLWGHSWEIEQNNDWEKLICVLNYVKKKGKEHGAEFLTNGEIFKYFR